MAMDRIDYAAILGMGALIAASRVLDGLLVGAALGGFVLSLATWRLRDGRVWEAVGWLAWVCTAVVLVLGPDGHPLAFAAFVGSMLLGVGLLFGGRLDLLPDVWSLDERRVTSGDPGDRDREGPEAGE